MCGIAPNEICKWSEALPGQFGFTKQLVFRVALPHITLLCLSITYKEKNYLNNNKTFIWNLFFSTTWLTSIGYGLNAPKRLIERIFCMFYLIFGIPLYLVTLADLAKFCTEGINRFYTELVKLRYQLLGFYRHRKRRIHANSGIEYIAIGTRGSRRLSSLKLSGQLIRNEEEMAEFLWKNLEKTHFVEVPFSIVYILLLSYILGSAKFVAYLEDWEFIDALYFIIMSVMTIGFGDLVPKNENFIFYQYFCYFNWINSCYYFY
ncbi:Ion_trans_2 domain-containing protein [Meloidogyne graminicola]|uniref:Ion_trans_2 domain-containing protein n=1 Tax=Meloidogyne graminicola TaxID=189291 RepID=A0A8S9ZJF2_9BILA|nr:Ion_trans_2 domain-containing protein [Meloidogyne graminicola]